MYKCLGCIETEEGNMQGTEEFRCPFEVKGRAEGTILEVALSDNKEGRLAAIGRAFADFHASENSPAIRFTLPKSILAACSSNSDLRRKIVPYQTEILAVELDYRLNPFLPYQIAKATKQEAYEIYKRNPAILLAAQGILNTFGELHAPLPENIAELSILLEVLIEEFVAKDGRSSGLVIFSENGDKTLPVLLIHPSGITFHADRGMAFADPTYKNKNTFGIVKSPFYPKPFGRWSEDVEIVVSREADFTALSPALRRRIRRQANTVHRAHRVRIADLDEDKQETGVWIPDYE